MHLLRPNFWPLWHVMLNPRRPAVADPCNQIFPDAFYKTPVVTPLFPLSHTSCLATTTNTGTDAANTAR